MASVRLKTGSKFWFACYKIPTGKVDQDGLPIFRRVQRSTGTADERKALQIANSFERAATAASEKAWSDVSARKFLTEISALTGITLADTEPTDSFLRRWLASRRVSISASSLVRYTSTVDSFLSFLGIRANGPIIDVTASTMVRFRDAEIASGKSAATVNKSLMILGQAFEEAVRFGIFTHNPARGLNVSGEKRQAQKRKPFTFEQFTEIVRVCTPGWKPAGAKLWKNQALSDDWQPFILLLGYTGGRQQEVAQLRWRQLDLKRGRVTLNRTKTGDEHWLPLHPSLHLYLHTLKPGGADDFVLPNISKIQRRHLSRAFRRRVLPRIGIVQKYEHNGDKGRKLAAYSLHSFRHSLATWLNEAGVDEMTRMRIVGHENVDVSRGYTHTELQSLASALSRIPSIPELKKAEA